MKSKNILLSRNIHSQSPELHCRKSDYLETTIVDKHRGKYTSEIITIKREGCLLNPTTGIAVIPEAVDQRLSVLLDTEQI